MTSHTPKVIAWYREARPMTFVRWVIGGVLVTLGMLIGSIGRMPAWLIPEPLQWALLGFGALLMLGGVMTVVANAFNSLGEEAYLLLRLDGVVYHAHDGEDHVIPWQTLDDVRIEEGTRHVALIRDEDHPPLILTHPFQDATPQALTTHIMDTRRRALMGLLR